MNRPSQHIFVNTYQYLEFISKLAFSNRLRSENGKWFLKKLLCSYKIPKQFYLGSIKFSLLFLFKNMNFQLIHKTLCLIYTYNLFNLTMNQKNPIVIHPSRSKYPKYHEWWIWPIQDKRFKKKFKKYEIRKCKKVCFKQLCEDADLKPWGSAYRLVLTNIKGSRASPELFFILHIS